MVDHEKLRRVYKRKLKRLRLIDDSFMTRFSGETSRERSCLSGHSWSALISPSRA